MCICHALPHCESSSTSARLPSLAPSDFLLRTLLGEQLNTEDINHLESLIKKLKMIEKRQTTLQEYVEADVKKVCS